METFPKEFSELLSTTGKSILAGKRPQISAAFQRSKPHYISIPKVIGRAAAKRSIDILNRGHYSSLSCLRKPIPRSAISEMKTNYSETLPKNLQMRTSYLASRKEIALGMETGLLKMMKSASFHSFAEALTGYRLARDWGCQLICYSHGDYAGPHNDHHPEDKSIRNGYVDLHIMFADDSVSHQWLVYERQGLLTNIQTINLNGAASAYLLPFWHYTTPMVARTGFEAEAHRWLLLGSFELAAPSRSRF